MAITRRILIKKTTSNSIKRLVVTAENIDGSITEYIFKFYRKPLNPLDNTGIRDVFVAVCSASELQDLPIQVPDDDSSGYFRSNVIDITYLSPLEAEAGWQEIQDGVEYLVAEIKATDNLGVESQIIFGDIVFLQVRTFNVSALLKRAGTLIQYYSDSVLKKSNVLHFGVEGSIGTYSQLFLSYTNDALLKATTTKSFECRCNISKTSSLSHTLYADIGRYTKSYSAGAILHGSTTKIFNAHSILKSQPVKTYTTDARLV